MRFAFTDEQLELRRAVRQVLHDHCTAADLRIEAARLAPTDGSPAGPAGPPDRWTVLAELGAVGLLAAETDGGLGLGEVELVGVLEEAGRAALPEPLAEAAALAVPLLAGRPELAAVATGVLPATVGGLDIGATGPVVAGTRTGDDVTTPRVPGTRLAELIVLFAPGTEDHGQLQVHAVPRHEATVEPSATVDPTRQLAVVRWRPGPGTLLAAGRQAAAMASATTHRASLATAAQLIGLADRLISETADYARQRHQFGRPIGSFQAVKHHVADARVALEFARPVAYRAAFSLATGDPAAGHDAFMAKAISSDAADTAAAMALQVHGAIGYTWECDLHLYLKRAWSLSAAWGDAATHRSLVLAAALASRRSP